MSPALKNMKFQSQHITFSSSKDIMTGVGGGSLSRFKVEGPIPKALLPPAQFIALSRPLFSALLNRNSLMNDC